MDTKTCSKCLETKLISDYYLNRGRPNGLSVWCRECQQKAGRQSSRSVRLQLIAALGGKCQQCDWTDPRALQVDHINSNGAEERRTREVHSQSRAFIAHVLSHPDEYQLLCANHNQIKKYEENETVGRRVYARTLPTEKRVGIGRGNGTGQKAALQKLLGDSEHQRRASRARWDNLTPEELASTKKILSKQATGRKKVTDPETGRWHWSHPGDADFPG